MTAPDCSLTRREALKGAGALVVAFSLSACGSPDRPLPVAARFGEDTIGAWLRIDAKGEVAVFTGKAELGQGIRAALAQIVADELDVAYERITVITADTGLTPDEGYTFGSLSVQQSGAAVRRAAAQARLSLRELAAARWSAPLDEIIAEDGELTGPGKRISYGEILSGEFFERTVAKDTPLKDVEDYHYVGRSLPRGDIPGKVFGAESYLQDVRASDMVFGRIIRPPSYGAALLSVDASRAERLPGVVTIVRDGSFLGVVALREETAQAAIDLLRDDSLWADDNPVTLEKDIGALVRSFPHYLSVLKAPLEPVSQSDLKKIAARYERPFQLHASIAPSAAIALWRDGQLTVWTHSQGVYPLRGALAAAFALPEETIRVIHKDGAGCFGHNGADDAAMDAAMLARAAPGRPVKLQWSREDEFQWEPCGPAMLMEAEAGLDASGRIAAWTYDVWGFAHSNRPGGAPGNLLAAQHRKAAIAPPPPVNIPQPTGGLDRNALPLYALPAQTIRERFIAARPVRTSSLRALGAYGNVFAIESFMDELAFVAGADPIAFRLDHLENERARRVITGVAEAAGWTMRKRPAEDGRGRGAAFAQYKNLGAYYAAIVDVAVDRATGQITLERITGAVDCGLAVNPDGVRNQIEGGAIQSASWTLLEQATFKNGRSSAQDWLTYPILKFTDIPDIETVIIDRKQAPPVGVGEASQGPIAAAIANAVFDATGARLRKIPFTPETVLAAMSPPAEQREQSL